MIHDSHPEPVPARTVTLWKNPTSQPVRFRIWLDVGRIKGQATQAARYLDVSIAPGETEELPTIYDPAIQRVEHGLVVAGLAPQLINTSVAVAPCVHPALVPVERAPRGAARRRV
jgi:hypothetical protein